MIIQIMMMMMMMMKMGQVVRVVDFESRQGFGFFHVRKLSR